MRSAHLLTRTAPLSGALRIEPLVCLNKSFLPALGLLTLALALRLNLSLTRTLTVA